MTVKHMPVALTKINVGDLSICNASKAVELEEKILKQTTGSSKSICFFLIPTYFLFT